MTSWTDRSFPSHLDVPAAVVSDDPAVAGASLETDSDNREQQRHEDAYSFEEWRDSR